MCFYRYPGTMGGIIVIFRERLNASTTNRWRIRVRDFFLFCWLFVSFVFPNVDIILSQNVIVYG